MTGVAKQTNSTQYANRLEFGALRTGGGSHKGISIDLHYNMYKPAVHVF
eukprot:COSAG02_NODE_7725_length_2873_cov_73.014468_2_plen_49_part_00